MAKFYKIKDGRVWLQKSKFQPYQLLLPYGLTNITDPVGNLAVFREPDVAQRGLSVIVDVARDEPGLATFDLDTRLQRTQNFLLGMKDCSYNIQSHMGHCDRPDNYFASSMIIHWERSHRGEGKIDRTAIIEGNNVPVNVSTPVTAEAGPFWFDLDTKFLSQRTVGEPDGFVAGAFLPSECLTDCQSQADMGQNGYAVAKATLGSPTNKADVWYTTDHGNTWAACINQHPLPAAMTPSDIIVVGTSKQHRVIVANGTTQAAAHAQIAYADITVMGTATWVTVNLPTANAIYILGLLMIDYMHIYACTSDGYIYRSSDGGATWVNVYNSGIVDFYSMAGLSDGTIWAVGASDLMIMSQDYGDTWTTITGPVGISADAKTVAVTKDGTVFVGYSDGSFYASFDWGVVWTAMSLQGITPTAIADVQVWNDSVVWVIAAIAGSTSRVLRSVDGGASFRLWKLAIPTNAGLNSMFLVDPNIVFVFGDPQGGEGFISKTASNLIGL
jgi:photosystem II stability/assembly factor-like uncharacterized protein